MKRKIILICILLIVSIMVASNYKYLKHEEQEHKIKESNIAIMVYDDESDSYIKQSSIPKGVKYSLNEELTKCESGGKVTNYNKANGTLRYEVDVADQCYVYFDVDNTPSYAIYSETDNSLVFYKNYDKPKVGETYNGKVTTAIYTGFETEEYVYKVNNPPWFGYKDEIKKVSVADEITPVSTACWFVSQLNLESVDLTNLDTSQVTTMHNMFNGAGYSSSNFELNLGDKFDTSNVTKMVTMFQQCGYSNPKFTLDLGDKFDTSKVTNMEGIFAAVGYNSLHFTLDLGDKFDTSSVINMRGMFMSVGYSNPNFTLDLGSKFDTSNATNMNLMFGNAGYSSTIFELDLGDKFDTSNVTNMRTMFQHCGRVNPNFTLDLGDKFDTSNVTDMSYMFCETGENSTIFTLNLGSKFDTSKVTNMTEMFQYTGRANPDFELDLSGFIVQSSCNLTSFLQYTYPKIILGEGWSNATLVSGMFLCDSPKTTIIVNAPTNIQNYNFEGDNRVVTFTTI